MATSLPVEVLQMIFLECLPPKHTPFWDVTESPWTLGQVSRFWRAVALSFPLLWTSFTCPFRDQHPPANIDFLASTRLNNCGQHPIHLSISFGTTPVASTALHVLLGHSEKVATLDLFLLSSVTQSVLDDLKSRRENFHTLQSLSIHSPCQQPLALVDVFQSAPRLEHADLRFYSRWPESQPEFPWSQLVHLELGRVVDVLQILRNASHLQSLRLDHARTHSPRWLVDMEYITLPELRSIHLNNQASGVVSQLVCPMLRTVHLSERADKNVFGLVSSMIQRSRCVVSELSVKDLVDVQTSDWAGLLASMDQLEQLSADLCSVDASSIRGAIGLLGDRQLAACASLRRFLLRGVPLESDIVQALLDALTTCSLPHLSVHVEFASSTPENCQGLLQSVHASKHDIHVSIDDGL